MVKTADIIAMARAAKSFSAAAAEDDTPPPSDELFIRAATAFSMLMRCGDLMKEMAVIVPDLDCLSRNYAVATIAQSFADSPSSTKERVDLLSTILPDDYVETLRVVVAGNRKALGLPPQPAGDGPHVCAGCIGGGPCDAHPSEGVEERDCAGCGAPPGIRCAKDCTSPHAWYDGDDEDDEVTP